MRFTKCYRCQQDIWFGETEKGKKIPVNAWKARGNSGKIIAIDPDADVPMVQFLKKTDAPPPEGTPRYHSHLGTCKPK
jgi:hypothetical protein